MTERKDRIEHTLEVLVYAPIGVGLYLRDMGPTFVNMFVARGRAEVDRRQAQVQQRTTTARSIGQVAVTFGVPMVRQRVEREVDDARQRAQSFLGTISGSDATNGAPAATPAPSEAKAGAAKSSVAKASVAKGGTGAKEPEAPLVPADSDGSQARDPALPIPGYNALSASQVVERLAGLAPDELEAVRTYEASHRKRRTILGKIDQISA
jgi:hypothetical protein